jgi:glycine cleavage system H protein
MSLPKDRKYTNEHEWIFIEEKNVASIGVTSYAVEQLGDIVHIELPEVGESFDAGASFGTIESTKTVSDLYMPVAGKIIEVNDDLVKSLESLQEDPFEEGWLVKVQLESEDGIKTLMDATAYEKFIKEQEG